MAWSLIEVLVLVTVIAMVLPAVFSALGIADKTQALGLPEGSVRALIAIVLLALFAASPIYLFDRLGGEERTLVNQSDTDKARLEADTHVLRPTFESIKGTPAKPAIQDKPAIPATPDTWTATYKEAPSPEEVDFAKQMIILLGTLATSVTSFYFGAKTATSASAQGAQQAADTTQQTPSLISLTTEPPQLPARGEDDSIKFMLHLQGNNLTNVTTTKLSSGNDVFSFASKSDATGVDCNVVCTPKVPAPSNWLVTVVDNQGTESGSLPGALSF